MDDDYDSGNDLDFEPFHQIAQHFNDAALETFAETAHDDRVQSNRFVKSVNNVVFQNPQTQDGYDRAWARFQVFYTVALKKEDVHIPVSCYLLLFLIVQYLSTMSNGTRCYQIHLHTSQQVDSHQPHRKVVSDDS